MAALNEVGHMYTRTSVAVAWPALCVLGTVTALSGTTAGGQFVSVKVGTKTTANVPVGSPAPEDTGSSSFHSSADCWMRRLL